MQSNWANVMSSRTRHVGRVKVFRATGWGGGYKRKPPTGEHKCLSRTDMAKLMAKLG